MSTGAFDLHEAGAEPFEAGKIHVAGGLINPPLDPVVGLQRLDRYAA